MRLVRLIRLIRKRLVIKEEGLFCRQGSDVRRVLFWNTGQLLMYSLKRDKQMLLMLCAYRRDIFYFSHELGELVSC
jgi:hypothetical protein